MAIQVKIQAASSFVTINYYVPYAMTCNQNYTFVAASDDTLNTAVNVEITWTGDLGGVVSGTVTILASTTCNSTSVFSGTIDCWGENISSTSVNLDPSSYGGQIYQVGTQYPIGMAPC